MSKEKPLKRLTVIDKIILWEYMDNVINKISDKKIISYWRKNGIPLTTENKKYKMFDYTSNKKKLKDVSYGDITCDRYSYSRIFNETDFNRIWRIFNLCINMSLDDDVDECLNALNAIEYNIED